MRALRPAARRDRDLLSGPARLCQAFGLDGAFDGADLVTADRGVTIVDDGAPPPDVPAVSTRIGLSVGHRAPVALVHPGLRSTCRSPPDVLLAAADARRARPTWRPPRAAVARRPRRATPATRPAARRSSRFIDAHPDALHRSCLEGHLTGSAAVVDPSTRQVLLLFHAKVQRWLQPGGHADGDGNLARVALREAEEETGIDGPPGAHAGHRPRRARVPQRRGTPSPTTCTSTCGTSCVAPAGAVSRAATRSPRRCAGSPVDELAVAGRRPGHACAWCGAALRALDELTALGSDVDRRGAGRHVVVGGEGVDVLGDLLAVPGRHVAGGPRDRCAARRRRPRGRRGRCASRRSTPPRSRRPRPPGASGSRSSTIAANRSLACVDDLGPLGGRLGLDRRRQRRHLVVGGLAHRLRLAAEGRVVEPVGRRLPARDRSARYST